MIKNLCSALILVSAMMLPNISKAAAASAPDLSGAIASVNKVNQEASEYVQAWLDYESQDTAAGSALKGAFFLTYKGFATGWNMSGNSSKGSDAARMTIAMLGGLGLGFVAFALSIPLMPVTALIGVTKSGIEKGVKSVRAHKEEDEYMESVKTFVAKRENFYEGDIALALIHQTKIALNITEEKWQASALGEKHFDSYFPNVDKATLQDRKAIEWINNTAEHLLNNDRISFSGEDFQALLSKCGIRNSFKDSLIIYGHVYILAKHYKNLKHTSIYDTNFKKLVEFAFDVEMD